MAKSTTSKASANSYPNTPQAKNDFFSFSEDHDLAAGLFALDVMANDLGGNGKSLYSVDSTSALGGLLSIVNGQVQYTFNGNINTLAQGEIAEDSFGYAIQMGNGTLSFAKASVSIVGVNDAPEMEGENQTATVVEDDILSATGQFTATDVDNRAILTFSGSADGEFGSFAVTEAGTWEYLLNNDSIQFLNASESRTETFTVTVTDEFGAADTREVSITIEGADEPVVEEPSGDGDNSGAGDNNSGQVKSFSVNLGQLVRNNGAYEILGFDGQSQLVYTGNPREINAEILDFNKDGILDTVVTFEANSKQSGDVVLIGFTGLEDAQIIAG